MTEGFISYLFKNVLDIEIPIPLPRMTYKDAIERYGTDKPDTRFSMEIKNISHLVSDCGFGVFTNAIKDGGSVQCNCC